MKNTIQVVPAGDCWCADWSNTNQAEQVMQLFGTTLIPTAFTRLADAQTVATHIARLNPTYTVAVIGGGECN